MNSCSFLHDQKWRGRWQLLLCQVHTLLDLIQRISPIPWPGPPNEQTASYQLSNQTWLHRSCSAKLQAGSSVFFLMEVLLLKSLMPRGCWAIVLAPCLRLGWALSSQQDREEWNNLAWCSALVVGDSEAEQPLLFAEEIDKAWSYRLYNVSLVMFFGDKQTHLQFTCEL